MKHKDIIKMGLDIFNLHPETKVLGVVDLLSKSMRYMDKWQYEQAAAHYAEWLARYIDQTQTESNKTQRGD